MFNKSLFFILIFFSLSFNSFAYFGDLNIEVYSDGRVSILGDSDYNEIFIDKTHKFTSKDGEFWILNLTSQVEFEELIYEINFPENAQINYLKGKNLKIDTSDSRLKILGFAENSNLNVLVQYSIASTHSNSESDLSFLGYFFSFAVLGLVILGIVFYVIFKKLKNTVVEVEHKNRREN